MRNRQNYNSIEYCLDQLLEKFAIIFEKIIFGDSVIERCNQTLDECDEDNDDKGNLK